MVDSLYYPPPNNPITQKGDFHCYEVKSSVEDFHSKNGHNLIGDYNYYVMPEDVYEAVKEDLRWSKAGVYVPVSPLKDGNLRHNSLKSVRKAKRSDREYTVSELLLMMFRSSNRELLKDTKKI